MKEHGTPIPFYRSLLIFIGFHDRFNLDRLNGDKRRQNSGLKDFSLLLSDKKGMHMRNRKDEIKKIISDLLWKYRRENPDHGWATIGSKAKTTSRTIERYANREHAPQKSMIVRVLTAIEAPDETISSILFEYYGVTTLSRQFPIQGFQEDRKTAYDVKDNSDKLKIWALASKKNGTNEQQIKNLVPSIKSEALTNEMLNTGSVREINNRIKSNDISFKDPKAHVDMAVTISSVVQDMFDCSETKAACLVMGLSKEGNEYIKKDIEEFCQKLKLRLEQTELRGDIPLILSLSSTNLDNGEK